MIFIGNPHFVDHGNIIHLESQVVDEKAGIKGNCYFSADQEYGDFLCTETADAFVLGLLLPALQSNQDIVVDGQLSERLYYNLSNFVINVLAKAFGYQEIKIKPSQLTVLQHNPQAVGTGCSLGVDSFSTILKHTAEDCPPSFKLTHLAYFNVGAHGEKNSADSREAYFRDLGKVREFAKVIDLPVVAMESNLPFFYTNYSYNFNQTHVLRNMSMVLAMQKLFKRYIYSSGYPATEIHLSGIDPTYMETMLLPAISTENTELITGDPALSRSAKAKIICDDKLVQKYLYVCCRDLVLNNEMYSGPWANVKSGSKRNCSRCDKCLRTLLIFDALNKIDLYADIFDPPPSSTLRTLYMAKVLGLKKRSYVFQDLYQFAVAEKYPIRLSARILSLIFRFRLNELFYRIAGVLRNKPRIKTNT